MTHHDYTSNPILNIVVSITLATIGSIIPYIEHLHIPVIIMQLFQIGAWSAAIILMLLALFKEFKKKKE